MIHAFKLSSIFISIFLIKCNTTPPITTSNSTSQLNNIYIKGITIEAPPKPIDTSVYINLKKLNSNWAALVPFAFSKQYQPTVFFNSNRQWWGEKDEGIITCIKLAHEQKMKVMLKPQLWIGGGTYTGHFILQNEADWISWEKSYNDYIMHNAKIAADYKVELLCIGTEMDETVKQRPSFWGNLIDSVKKIYSGKLTYAANWDSYEKFSHWSKLDFIGVDAYFPLHDSDTPTVENIKIAWKKHVAKLESTAKTYNKEILFTEYGYRSVDKCADKPWESYENGNTNMVAQSNAFEALYSTFAPYKWFAGGFIWKWHTDDTRLESKNSDYTPQHKPVELVIKKWYE
jgi:hypothetical protein